MVKGLKLKNKLEEEKNFNKVLNLKAQILNQKEVLVKYVS
jgi:hypothetical protein